jgi:transcription initiation factor TFIIIB Brf1 subunit/transcription initiation factor TFIIB
MVAAVIRVGYRQAKVEKKFKEICTLKHVPKKKIGSAAWYYEEDLGRESEIYFIATAFKWLELPVLVIARLIP